MLHVCTLSEDMNSHISERAHEHVDSGAVATAKVDYVRRRLIAPNHSMTHVLNFALREVRNRCDYMYMCHVCMYVMSCHVMYVCI